MRVLVPIFSSVLACSVASGAEWQVAPKGTPEGKGTQDAPWDLGSALAGRHKVAPGDTLWVAGGTYVKPADSSHGFPVALAGRAWAPVRVRARPGERATVDGGLVVQAPAEYVWIEGLELLVSQPRPGRPVPPDPSYRNVNRPWGGLNVNAGTGCKYINLVIHDNCQGVSFWSGARDSELYGCLIYDNGWQGTDRGHGHAVYTQNRDGTKTIRDCIMTGGFGFTMHAYGSKEPTWTITSSRATSSTRPGRSWSAAASPARTSASATTISMACPCRSATPRPTTKTARSTTT
jgi:hypothetical protein